MEIPTHIFGNIFTCLGGLDPSSPGDRPVYLDCYLLEDIDPSHFSGHHFEVIIADMACGVLEFWKKMEDKEATATVLFSAKLDK